MHHAMGLSHGMPKMAGGFWKTRGLLDMNIGARIKKRRTQLRMSADELARKIGKDRSTVYRYESGHIDNVAIATLESLAKILKTTPAYLMGLDTDGHDFSSAHVVRDGVVATFVASNPTLVRHMENWVREVGDIELTDEEHQELIRYANYLLYKRTGR